MPKRGSKYVIEHVITLTNVGRGELAEPPSYLSDDYKRQLVMHLTDASPMSMFIQGLLDTYSIHKEYMSLYIGAMFIEKEIHYNRDDYAFPVFVAKTPITFELNPLYYHYSIISE